MKKYMLIILPIVCIVLWMQFIESNLERKVIAAAEVDQSGDFEIIHIEYLNNGAVVFYIQDNFSDRKSENNSFILGTAYVKNQTFGRWQWVYGHEHTVIDALVTEDQLDKCLHWSPMYISSENLKVGSTPFPIIYGTIHNHEIEAIILRNKHTNLNQMARTININENTRLFFLLLNDVDNEFKLIANSNGGQVFDSVSVKKLNSEKIN